jgi:general secretion pathway protein K
MRIDQWGRMVSCGGLPTRPGLRRLPIGAQVRNLPHSGSALLAVLWLTAALSAIAFSVASTVRAETERTSTSLDSLHAYYLATGAISRAMLRIEWGPAFRNPDGTSMFDGSRPVVKMQFEFPTGSAVVDLIPETAKLNVNQAPAEQLMNLLLALGTMPEQAQAIAIGILDWRAPSPGGSFTEFDQYYLTLTPSFRARHASLQEIEELLLVRGVTRDLFYGSYIHDPQGNLVRRAGLRDCLSVYGSSAMIDVNTAEPAVMQAIGVSAGAVAAIVALRKTSPIASSDQISSFSDGSTGFSRLQRTQTTMATLRATARVRLADGQYSDLRRSVEALVKFLGPEWNPPFHIMRWYDQAWSNQAWSNQAGSNQAGSNQAWSNPTVTLQ